MTLEELMALLKDSEELKKGVIGELRKSGDVKIDDDVKALEINRDEILAEKRTLKNKFDEQQTEITGLKEKLDKIKDGSDNSGEVAVLKDQLKEMSDKYEAAETSRAALEKDVNDSFVNSQLSKHLASAKVDDVYKEVLITKFLTQAELKNHDGQKVILFGDKTAESFFSEWAESDEAKHFRKASDNSGGGASGGSGGGGNPGEFSLQNKISSLTANKK